MIHIFSWSLLCLYHTISSNPFFLILVKRNCYPNPAIFAVLSTASRCNSSILDSIATFHIMIRTKSVFWVALPSHQTLRVSWIGNLRGTPTRLVRGQSTFIEAIRHSAMAPAIVSRHEGAKVPLGGQVFSVILALTAVTVLTLFLSEITIRYSKQSPTKLTAMNMLAQRVLAIKFWRLLPPVVWCQSSWLCLI